MKLPLAGSIPAEAFQMSSGDAEALFVIGLTSR
jgi:hypothetical protein